MSIEDWKFMQLVGPARTGPNDNYELGLAWRHPDGPGASALVQRGSLLELIVWPNASTASSTIGLRHRTRPLRGEELVAMLARADGALRTLYGADPRPVDPGAAVLDPRAALLPAPGEAGAGGGAPKDDGKQQESAAPPSEPPAAEAPPAPAVPVTELVAAVADAAPPAPEAPVG